MVWQGNKAPQEAEVDSKLPDYPRVLFRGKRFAKERWRSASISLDGLLDYDEEVLLLLHVLQCCDCNGRTTPG